MSDKNQKDRPWMFRTYAGHSTAKASNALYKTNLLKGQTGLSVAFDLPTQTGYDADHVLAKGEAGKVGVPIAHIGDMRTLFDNIPLGEMNTSMTINATAAWLLALYIAVADERGVDRKSLTGTTQNDIIKEYLSRGTYVFPPEPSMRLITDMINFTTNELPKWNPMNVCSYHLQEAGAKPVQELAYALATAIAVLDQVKASAVISEEDFPKVVGRISFFVNAGMRFITEMCKMRAFVDLWDEICLNRYGVKEEKYRRFRYGVQVNSLGLTEQQPENNVYRILLEMLAVTLSKKGRARAVQLPAWNEALGLPRPWDQQWSLRMQQVLAYESDLLEYGDIFEGSVEINNKVEELKKAAREELQKIEDMGGSLAALENGYLKSQLVSANAARLADIQSGEQVVIGVNAFIESEISPLSSGENNIVSVSDDVEIDQINALREWRKLRDEKAVKAALSHLTEAAKNGENIMPASIEAAKAGVTTGEWGEVLRDIFGHYRAPTGVEQAVVKLPDTYTDAKKAVNALREKLKDDPRFLVGKPGLDGHSNGAEQIAVFARESGFEVIYDGIRQTPDEIVQKAIESNAHAIGLSILSGNHIPLVRDVMGKLREKGITTPVLVGGIIPKKDENILKQLGVAGVYTPKDFQINEIVEDITKLISV